MNKTERAPTATQASLMLLLATMTWGAAFPVSKFIMADMDVLSMTLLRYLSAVPIYLLVLRWQEGPSALQAGGKAWRLFGLGALGFAGFNLLMFYGVAMSRPEFGAIVMALQPLIAVLIGWARSGQRPPARSFVALALAVTGVVLLTTDGHVERLVQHAAVLPTLMMIAGGTCWVLYSMGAAHFQGWSSLRYTALTSTGGALALVIAWCVSLGLGGVYLPTADRLPSLLPALLFVTLLSAVIAVLSWNKGLRRLGAQRGMLFINVVPLTALLIGVLRGQAFGGWEVLGAVLVLASLLLNQLSFGNRPPLLPGKLAQARS